MSEMHHGAKRRNQTGELQKASSASSRPLRCAIYTRKSTEEGLNQDFNSLQAQREACEAYIASQRHEGWSLMPTGFDDGGFSGGSMERPGLTNLLAEVRAGHVDVVVVYKVDRLTRSLADFAKIVEIFDVAGVSFVSVTQSFNTTTSMGRLTLNVLLSFAQFEREVTAERIRDKIAASKKKGMWMGGPIPLGYRVEARKLVINAAEAETVRLIFATYLEQRSLPATVEALKRQGVLTRRRVKRDGSTYGGIPFTRGPLQELLRNRLYVGEMRHKDEHHPGEHEPIIDRETFEAVQRLLTAQRTSPTRSKHRMASLLTGRIFDSAGNRMTPTHTNKGGLRYRYYASSALLDGDKNQAGSPARISAPEVEDLVVTALRGRAEIAGPSKNSDDANLIETLLERVDVFPERIVLTPFGSCESDRSAANATHDKPSLTIDIPCRLGTQSVERHVLEPNPSPADPRLPLNGPQSGNRQRLLGAIHRARAWLDDLVNDRVQNTEAIALREGRSDRNVRMFLNLAFLAPDLVEAAINGDLPAALSATQIAQALPLDWDTQRKMILGK